MSSDDRFDDSVPVPPTEEQAFQDRLIAERIPHWLRAASVEQLRELGDAMSLSLYFNQRVSEVLGAIQDVAAFTQPLLQQALDQAVGESVNLAGVVQRWGHREPVVTSQPIGYPVTRAVYTQRSLLEAAWRNFTPDDATPGGQLVGNRLERVGASAGGAQEGEKPLPTSAGFALLCRRLDLGKAYQSHLRGLLQPASLPSDPEGEGRRRVLSLFARAHRYTMLADAHVALIKGEVTPAEHQLLVELCSLRGPLQFDGKPVEIKRLDLLGCALEQILVLDVRDQRFSPLYTSSTRVLVHIPGDPHSPWRAHADLRGFANALGKHLRTADYQRFFARFVRRRDSQAFFSAVDQGYEGLSDLANTDLRERLRSCPAPVFDTLGNDRIAQIMDDAAMLAVPTAALDRQVQQAHDQRLAAEGWTLLNLAGLFVPGLGLALLGYAGWQLLREVYHGVDAWHEGDSAEALEHLVNVATDVAVLAATAAGFTVARNAWSRSRWVDDMVPAHLDSGMRKLWQPDVTAYRVAAPPAEALRDEAGVYRLAERAWIEMDGHHYPVAQRVSDGRWHLLSRDGHSPSLCHNGAGAWRLWCEQPAEWADTPRMFRRLGGVCAELDEQRIEQVMWVHGLDADHLRAWHVHGQAPEAGLIDSVERFVIDRRLAELTDALQAGRAVDDPQALQLLQAVAGTQGVDAAQATVHRRAWFDALYQASQPAEDAASATLRRIFPSLHRRGASELLRAAKVADRQAVSGLGRVPPALAQAARASARQQRLARALQGFYLEAPQTADLARVVLYLEAGVPGIRWRLFEGSAQGALLMEVGAEHSGVAYDVIHHAGQFRILSGGQLLAGPGELFQTLAAPLATDAGELRGSLRTLAGPRRAELTALFEPVSPPRWFRAPQRLEGGRLGYPLSGRGRGRSAGLYATVRGLYPAFDDAQVQRWLAQVRQLGRQVEAELVRLASELETLSRSLHTWSRQAVGRLQRADRHSFAEALQRCWQRRADDTDATLPGAFRLTIRNLTVEQLPDLPEQVHFEHVRELSLMAMGISEIPAGFLRAFRTLRIIELMGNRLDRIPAGLGQLTLLRQLDLFGNQIVLDAGQSMMLANLEHLEYINLSYNPLGQVFSVQRMARLRHLYLRATGLAVLPDGLFGRFELLLADLRDNDITRVPARFYRAPAWISAAVRLEGNPLPEGDALRLEAFMRDHGWSAELTGDLEPTATRQRWLDAADSTARTQQAMFWDDLESQAEASDFFLLLSRLLETADFQQQPVALASRVFTMLAAMEAQESLSIELFAQAGLPVTCQDSAALAFSDLELRLLVWQARYDAQAGGEESALLRLGRQLWRLEQVDRIAERDYTTRRAGGADPDQIEIMLAYRIGLREALALPAQPGDMLFAETAGLSSAQVDLARAEVLSQETVERLVQSLVDRDFWREYLLQAHAERFEALDVGFHDRVDTLMTAVETLPEGRYLEQMNEVQRERDVARRALMLRLTRQALGELSPLPAGPGEAPAAPGP
ncbi:NEL-type E3 ubiquitin ligase domain-containing protein [Serratia sp. Se-PFBMAAmG]|nr:NEL-type E3 ubiquitin ligase domain-containing protein [Serratia sp. Se-PFBMAAmG]